jgi:hypothetical protein
MQAKEDGQWNTTSTKACRVQFQYSTKDKRDIKIPSNVLKKKGIVS